MKRLWCYFRGHRLLRKTVEDNRLNYWTTCVRCRQVMIRGYDGWQRATRAEKGSYKRALAREKARDQLAPSQDEAV